MTQENFNQEIIKQSVEFIKENMASIKAKIEKAEGMPLNEAAQALLIDKYGIAQIEAAEIVADLQKGITDFETQFNATSQDESTTVSQQLESLTAGMEEENRINCYANILTALQLMGKEDITQKDIEKALDENAQKEADVLVSEIEYRFNNDIPLEAIANTVKEKLDANSLSKLAQQIALNKEDARLMTALSLYMAQREGKIKLSDSEVGLPASVLGALANASIETILVTNDLNEGKITLKRWQTVMKWILGTLLYVALSALALGAIMVISLASFGLVLDILGFSLVTVILGLLFGCYVSGQLAGWAVDKMAWVMETMSEVYDKYIGPVTQKVKSWVEKIRNWILEITGIAKNKINQVKENMRQATVQEETVATQPVQVQA